jgi:CheY-like chemotaxis protein
VFSLLRNIKRMRNIALKQLADLQYHTLSAKNGKEALDVLEHHPDVKLLFTDVIMPGGMTGFELANTAQKRFTNLKVLLTSGYTAHAMASGFNDLDGLEFLRKPFRRTELAEKLKTILRNAEG